MDSYTNYALYPFSIESLPILLYLQKFQPQMHIANAIAPPGMGMLGRDAGWIDNRPSVGIPVTEDWESALRASEGLLLAGGKETDERHNQSLFILKEAIRQRKNSLCAMELSEPVLEELMEWSKQNQAPFRYIPGEREHSTQDQLLSASNRRRYVPPVPVIGVGGLIEEANTFEVFLSITHQLRTQGKRVCTITGKEYASLYGLHGLPSLFFKGYGFDSDRIYTVLDLLQRWVERESPDVIVVEFPGGMIRYNELLTNGFGVLSYLLSQAVTPNYFICCTGYQFYSESFAHMLSQNFQQRFGFSIDCFHMGNCLLDVNDAVNHAKLSFLHVAHERVQEHIRQYGAEEIPVYNLLNPQMLEVCMGRIDSVLAGVSTAYTLV